MRVTERSSNYCNLEQMPVREILTNINREDQTVPAAVERCIPQIEKLVDGIVERMKVGGRLFYLGAGTSGRLGIMDASEIPPTYGVPFDLVVGLIAGGDRAVFRAVEAAEDSFEGGWNDLQLYNVDIKDIIVGITASGTTPYVIGAVREAKKRGILTACITCNPDSPLSREVDIPIEAIVGPEFVTGSTRMKSGTAQKLILNMISTSAMIRLGHIKGSKMIDMQLTNAKLIDRGARMIMEEGGISDYEAAKRLLLLHKSVRNAVHSYQSGKISVLTD